MPGSPWVRRLRRLVNIRPEETSTVVSLFFIFFLITGSAYVIKPVKVSLFLGALTSKKLPLAMLITSALIGFLVSLNTRLLERMNRFRYVSASLFVFAVSFILFWLVFPLQWTWVFYLYWFWADLFIVMSVFQFWVLVNDIFNPRQAKRLIGFFVSGGLLGGIAGSLAASRLALALGTANLLLVCPLLLVVGLVLLRRLRPLLAKAHDDRERGAEGQAAEKIGYVESFRIVRRHRYLLFLSGIMVSASAVTTLLEFQFNAVAEKAFPHLNARTSFLGTFYFGLLIFSYLVNVLLASRIIRSFGFRVALVITPLALLLGSAAIFVVPAAALIYWAVPVKGLDKSLAHSLHQSVRELLYIPIPPDIKYKAKVFIDMFVNKLGDSLASLLLLAVLFLFQFNVQGISVLTILFLAAWIVFALLITREYVHIVKRQLKLKWQDAGRLVSEHIDVDMTKLVFDTLESRKRSSVLYAMNLFDLIRKEKLSPELRRIIATRADELRASSFDALLDVDGEPLFPETDDSLVDEGLDAQVQEVMALDVYREMMAEHLHRVAAEHGATSEVSRMEAAKALGLMPRDSPLVKNLRLLLRDESAEVASYALDSAAKLGRRDFVPLIIPRLGQPALTQAAAKALVSYGEKIAGTLKDHLVDADQELRVRKSIPDILAQVGSQRAAELLALALGRAGDVEPEVIEGLSRLRRENPKIVFPEEAICAPLYRLILRGYSILLAYNNETARAARTEEVEAGLSQTLREVFALLSLLYPAEDIWKAYQNLCSGTKKSIDYSLELLDHTLKKELKQFLLPLIDEVSYEEKKRRCQKLLRSLEKIVQP